jgi:Ricin-type beta-trefoil lectin domain/Putative Ig domain
MRKSVRARRGWALGAAAGILLGGVALGAATIPATMASAAGNTITVTSPGDSTTPLDTPVTIGLTATETDPTQKLTFTAMGSPALPAGVGIAAASQPTAPGSPESASITGTFTAPYSGTVTVTATDGTATSPDVTFTLTAGNKITVTPVAAQTSTIAVPLAAPLPVGAADSDKSATLTFSDTTAGAPTVHTLPPGLAIDAATGDITGTPTTDGTYPVTISVTDGKGGTGTATFTWKVLNVVTVTVPATVTSPFGTPITPITATATDSTQAQVLIWSATTLPPGLVIGKMSGTISGKPTKSGTFAVTVTATDGVGSIGTGVIQWTVGAEDKITVSGAPAAKTLYAGVATSVKLSAKDAVAAEQGSLTWGAAPLPAGLTIDKATGAISGRPSKLQKVTTTVTATDSTGAAGFATITFTVKAPVTIAIIAPNWKTATHPAGLGFGLPLKDTDAVKGDKQKFSATLPAGVRLATSPFMLYGWPTRPGKYVIQLHEKGSLGTSDTVAIPLHVTGAPATGAAGQIRLALDGKCLQDPGNKTANGARVQITNCVSGSTEKWHLAADGTIRINGRCLNVAGTSGYRGKAAQLWTCNAGPRQAWTVGSKGELVSPASGLCLTGPGASRGNGVVPVMANCAAKSAEQWTTPAHQVLTPLGGCLDDLHSVGSDGAIVDKYFCNNSVAQTWTFATNGMIRGGQYPADCLTPRRTKAVLWRCASGGGSVWSVIPAGGLGVELKVGSVCLAMPRLTAGDMTQLVTTKCSASNPLDLWHIW